MDRFELNTSIASLDLSFSMVYVGNDLDNLEWRDTAIEADLELSPGEIPLVGPEEDVRFSLEHARVRASLVLK